MISMEGVANEPKTLPTIAAISLQGEAAYRRSVEGQTVHFNWEHDTGYLMQGDHLQKNIVAKEGAPGHLDT